MALTPEAVYAILKRYVHDTAIGFGAVKGAPCTIKSIQKDGKKNIVTFEWTATTGEKRTSQLTVLDGEDGGLGTYTNPSVGREVGGVPLGHKFQDTPIVDVLDLLFSPSYEKPQISIGLSCKNLYSQNDPATWPTSVTVTANVIKKTDDIKSVVCKVNGVVVETKTSGVKDGGKFTFTCPALTATTTFRVETSDGKNTVGTQSVVTIVGNSYSGYISELGTIDDVNPANLTPNLKTTKAFSYTSSFLDDGNTYRIVYMYPKSLGALTSITDNMGFPNLDEYERFEKQFDNIDYYVYISPATGVSGLVQDYK